MKDDNGQFITLYTSAQPALQRYIAAHLPDLHEAENVLQQVAVLLWKKFDRYEQDTSFKAWAFRIAQYEVLHARRKHARSRLVLTPELSERAAEHYENVDFQSVETKRSALQSCLAKLRPAHSDLMMARYKRNRRCTEIAEEQGCAENKIRTQLCRIRAALRKCVDKVLGDTGAGLPEVSA